MKPVAAVVCLLVVLAGCSGPTGTTQTPTGDVVSTGQPPVTTTDADSIPTVSPTDSQSTAAPTRTPPSTRQWTVTVTEVVDGDTMDVRFENGTTEEVRLLGVDTPEVHVENDPAEFEGIPDTEAGAAWLAGWGENASEFARTELAGETVTISLDPAADRRGSYGRLLVYIEHDGELFNRRLLARGYARYYDAPLTRADAFQRIEQRARERDVGLWDYPEERVPARLGGPHAA
ncbi:thermonuclease family protein [Halococcus sp. AFM35]|uniref:thermonuclease family protein n=1 Tax=Halococcus sp. AFM35 TaxID=3421653 RepID=UPI003EBD1E04